MNDKSCRLCLNAISGGEFQLIENLEDILNQLLLNLNLDISSKAVVCDTCADNLQRFSNFKKSACVNTVDSKYTLLDTKIDEFVSEEVNYTIINSAGKLKICCFCRKSLGMRDCISLSETKKNVFLMDMVQKHILERNLNYTAELLTCYACLDSLQNFSNFIRACLDVEEIIKKYVKMKGTNDKGQIELNNVQKFTFKPVSKYEAGCSNVTKTEEGGDKREENTIVETQAEIKSEGEEIYYTYLKIKPEELDIALKEDACESFQVNSLSTEPARISTVKFETYKDHLDAMEHRCNICLFRAENKISIKRRMLRHKDPLEIIMYKCDSCSYETRFKWNLRTHMSLKHNPPESITYRCATCSFNTRNKKALKRHVKIHIMYGCEFCCFQSKYKSNLRVHLLSHQVSFGTFDCDKCLYEAKTLKRLRDHMMLHGADVEMFKCQLCSFQTKYKKSLRYHLQRHKDPAKATIFQCKMCLYKTEVKDDLKKHMVIHKNVLGKSLETCIFPESVWSSKICPKDIHRGYLNGPSQEGPTQDLFKSNIECPKNIKTYGKRKPPAPQHLNGVLTAETGET